MHRALLLFLLLLTTSANAKGPFGSIHVGNWVGGAYTDDNTGTFSHCAANASYPAAFLFVAVDASGNWKLAFRNEAWNLTTGEGIPIDLTFDGQSQFHVFGQVQDPHFVIVVMPPSASLMRTFRRAQLMSAFAKGQTFQFMLTSTDRLMSALSECRQTLLAHGMSAARDFGNQRSQPAPAAVPPVASLTPPPQSAPQFRDDAIELATNFILKTGLRNPHLLTKAETPTDLVSNGAAWKADDAGGFVRIIQGDMKGIDVAAAVAAGDAKECTGKFASGRVSELAHV
jgi:hypothetical protein